MSKRNSRILARALESPRTDCITAVFVSDSTGSRSLSGGTPVARLPQAVTCMHDVTVAAAVTGGSTHIPEHHNLEHLCDINKSCKKRFRDVVIFFLIICIENI